MPEHYSLGEVTRGALKGLGRVGCSAVRESGGLVYSAGVSDLDDELARELGRIEAAGLRRSLRRTDGPAGPWIELEGRRLSSFSSNNYLGLAGSSVLTAAARDALSAVGMGSTASRLIAGNHAEHEALEEALRRFHQVEGVLLFNSGFQANVGTIPALVGPEDLVLSDRLNHASLIDGTRLSRARVQIYPHADLDAVDRLLAESRTSARRCLVVTESVFSMDGDRAPLEGLREICDRHRAWLMVDEAHAVGALGPGGRGIAAELEVVPDVLVGTLGKAMGSFGAYVAGSDMLRELLVQRARSFVFTTALPPAVAAASRAAVELLGGPDGEGRRNALASHIAQIRDGLEDLGLLIDGAGTTPIFPLWAGAEERALRASRTLFERGMHVQAIRPPTVPRGTSRLRLALMATHEPAQLDHLLAELADLARTEALPAPPRPLPRG